ncbi:MAG: MBL fold metallo-hydrolase [Oscillospiraceae bacterium]|nr:MBL fold metallo-hydrolase [Oscillospiraceae bacterium]MDY2909865.1 MBL fold metallo-hydrolase [Oscillospiraceae bacterium]
MRIVTFASGSTGNCCLVSDGGVNVLIDAGISARRIVQGLGVLGLAPQDVCGVLITHEHSDHISGLPVLVKRTGMRIFAPSELGEVLKRVKPELSESIDYIPPDGGLCVGDVRITAFPTPHDASASFGYRIEGSEVFAFATDTGHISDELLEGLQGADTVVIEANHDKVMLKNGPYPPFLKQRVLSKHGHLSNDDCAKLACLLADSGTRQIILGHLSQQNNTPEAAETAVSEALSGRNVKIYTAPANKLLEVLIGDGVQC